MTMKMKQSPSSAIIENDIICLQGIQCEGVIGVYDWERNAPRALLIDLQLPTAASHAAMQDNVTDTVDYAKVVARVRELVAQRSDALIETLAHHVAQDLLTRFQLEWIELTLHKPHIIDGVADVSITLYRQARA
jgi:dihydroneopterin aldolase